MDKKDKRETEGAYVVSEQDLMTPSCLRKQQPQTVIRQPEKHMQCPFVINLKLTNNKI